LLKIAVFHAFLRFSGTWLGKDSQIDKICVLLVIHEGNAVSTAVQTLVHTLGSAAKKEKTTLLIKTERFNTKENIAFHYNFISLMYFSTTKHLWLLINS
jgi:hypothetical protein